MKRSIASILVLATLFTACATTPQPAAPKQKAKNVKEWINQNRARKSAVAGAILGGLLGAASGIIQGKQGDEVIERAIAGAAIGAVAGFSVGKHQDQIYAGRDLAIRYAGYDTSQGYIARVEKV